MDPKFQTSFIPKKPVLGTRPHAPISLFLLVSMLAFFVTVGIGGYVFLEKKLLIQQITSEQTQITQNKNGLISDEATIENIVELNNRIAVAGTLLNNHVAIEPIFNFLQQATLPNVRFTNFSFTTNAGSGNAGPTVQVLLSGLARDWETVASQADEFALPDWKNIISQPKISDLSLNADGSVSFSFSATVNPSQLSYQKVSAAQ